MNAVGIFHFWTGINQKAWHLDMDATGMYNGARKMKAGNYDIDGKCTECNTLHPCNCEIDVVKCSECNEGIGDYVCKHCEYVFKKQDEQLRDFGR